MQELIEQLKRTIKEEKDTISTATGLVFVKTKQTGQGFWITKTFNTKEK